MVSTTLKKTCVVVVTGVGQNSPLHEVIRCVKSVKEQSYPNVRHVVVFDGSYPHEAGGTGLASVETITLPRATGDDGFNSHLIYAASSFLFAKDDEYVCFLDADNFFRKDHSR